MNILIALVALAGMFSNTGCRSARDNQIDILERELRAQEDYIYELEDYIVDYSEKLRQYRCADMGTVVATKQSNEPELAAPQRAQTGDPVSPPRDAQKTRDEAVEDTAPDTLESPPHQQQREESFENFEIPELEIGGPIGLADPYEAATPLPGAEFDGVLLADGSFVPDPATYQTVSMADATNDELLEDAYGEELVHESVQPFEEDITPTRSREPERLVISHVFRDSQGTEAPSSLLSVVEARDASNEPADFDGKVSLMVMTMVNDKPQRIRRWDFTAEETAAAWQSSNLGDGLHLELPLEETELPLSPLELWVRLEMADGGKLLAQIPFDTVTLASISEAETYLAEVDDEIDGATHLADANPLRHDAPTIKTEPIEPPVTTTATSQTKAEPQWRAATHYSTGLSTGYGTTATAERWNTQPQGSKTATTAEQPTPKSAHQWRARRK